MQNKTQIYYRVKDLQSKKYFATGYNAESIEELINKFKAYINGDNVPAKDFTTWQKIADYIQPIQLEMGQWPFEDL
jgi:hypothetical protein